MRNIIWFFIILMPAWASAQIAPGQQINAELGIVAVVNDEVITSLDVADRSAFIMATTRLPRTAETMQRLIPQVTRQLIDETLQVQEAERLGITVTRQDINEGVDTIAARRNVNRQAVYDELKAIGAPKETFEQQVKAQLAWQQVVARRIRPDVKVSDTEVERTRLMESLKLSADSALEVKISSLVLPVTKPEEEAEVKELAQSLVNDLRSGTEFSRVASQFGSGQGSEPIWTPLADLEPSLAEVLKKAVPGSVSNPARAPGGYVIVKLHERRSSSLAEINDSELLIKNILLESTDDSPEATELSLMLAGEVTHAAGSCESTELDGIEDAEAIGIQVQFIQARFSELNQATQSVVADLIVGAVSEPVAGADGIRVLKLCERADAPPTMASQEETFALLMNKRMTLETQKYLRNLRRDAFIELRR